MANFFKPILKLIMKPFEIIFDIIKTVINCAKMAVIFLLTIPKFFVKVGLWIFAGLDFKELFKMKIKNNKPVGLMQYLLRFGYVSITRIMKLPMCAPWYILDMIGWLLYLPFRFVFWSIDYLANIGVVELEHSFWNFAADTDCYIHGRDDNEFIDQCDPDMKESLNTGVHIIHFPDSVMRTCYNIELFTLGPFPKFDAVSKAFNNLMNCGKKKAKPVLTVVGNDKTQANEDK